MRFALSDDVLAVQDGVRSLLADRCPPAVVRAAWSDDAHVVDPLWQGLADLGVFGLLVGEDLGGLGLDELFVVATLEEVGYAAVPGPVTETVAVAGPLLAAAAGRADGALADLLGDVMGGAIRVTCRIGHDGPLPWSGRCQAAVVGDTDRVWLLRYGPGDLEPVVTVDGARAAGQLAPGLGGAQLAVEQADLARAFERGALATAAQLLGLGRKMVDMAVPYVTERRQFGAPVGSFQAVKHSLADAHLGLELARPVLHRAAYSLARGEDDAALYVSHAKAAATEAALVAARHTLQCHGAIGYTVDYDLHLFMKRVWALAPEWGDAAWHRRRIGRHLGLEL